MWEYFMYTYGNQIILAILTIVFVAAAIVAYSLARKYLDTDTKRKVAKIVVVAVEQIFDALHGEEKMGKALEYAATLLKKYGVKFDADEMRLLLEAALGEANRVFDRLVLEGIDVEDLDADQLRELLKQMGLPAPMSFTRDELLAVLDESAAQANT
jgi:hypothetical protein